MGKQKKIIEMVSRKNGLWKWNTMFASSSVIQLTAVITKSNYRVKTNFKRLQSDREWKLGTTPVI